MDDHGLYGLHGQKHCPLNITVIAVKNMVFLSNLMTRYPNLGIFTVIAVYISRQGMMDVKLIAQMVRFHRKKSGLSQEGLAQLAGIGKTVVFDIEKGKLSIRFDTLLKVFEVLNIKIEYKSPLMGLFAEQLNEKS